MAPWYRENTTVNVFGTTINLGDLTALPLVVGYALCSSLLAIINKFAIDVFPYPSLLTALQYLTCVVAVGGLGFMKLLEHDMLKWDMIKKFLPAAFVFYMAIFTNTTLLKYANVDTFIVFRSSTPLLVALADYVFRKQPWPSSYTFGALFVILAGAVGYVVTDSQFTVRAYTWAFAYLFTITFEMVYIKHIVSSLGLNTWGFVLYNNFLSLIMAPVFWMITGEFKDTLAATADAEWRMGIIIPVALSCAFGLAISFFGFACRKAISATAFTVLGVTNKLLTVVINVLIWDKHASNFGVMCLLVTIIGGVMYQQSTVKQNFKAAPPQSDEEEAKPLKSPAEDSQSTELHSVNTK
eukprot:TRINITY_DN25453_c0_g1_i1.p1 TRINITY_DN25453_c0_g1~~TRINITY_DN25453_c0_g1_i1.p1  ORF type:complete len:353 (+),score=33.05 TRINITY_DN25453_c0_g1_i1:506-1564(+)